MPPGGGSTPRNIVGGNVLRKPPLRIFERSIEKISPENLQWERHVSAVEAMQEQERAMQEQEREQMTAAIVGSLSFKVVGHPPHHLEILEGYHVEDGQITWNDVSDIRGTLTPPLVTDSTQQGEGQPLKDSAKPPDDTEFLKGTNYFKTNSDKQKATTRNKRCSKKHKKKKGKGKARKQSHASEMQSDEPPTEPSSTCAAATGGETLASSSSRAAVRVPLEYSSSSSSSHVTARLIITPAVNSLSSGNEKELLAASSSNDDFKSFKSTTSYATVASSSVNGYASSLSDARSERSLSASDSTNSRGFKKTSGEGNRPNVHQSFNLAIGPGCSQKARFCTDFDRNDGDFQKVVSRKSAQKMKKMQRQEKPSPISTMAASGPIITRELVPRAPFREVITIGHYINDDIFYGRKPNQKKGKYQKARSSSNSNLSKTDYTDGDNVSGSNRMVVITTVHKAKPRSGHHVTLEANVTLEAIKETNSPSYLPKEGDQLNATAPVGDVIENKDSKAPTSDESSSLGSPVTNSSCANNREEQKNAAAIVGADSKEHKTEEKGIAFSTYSSCELDKIITAANNAYEIQAASDVYMISGIRADIENFIREATPIIGKISQTKSTISMQDHSLWSVWRWYEQPECFGIEVQIQGKINSIWPEFSAYFRPVLSAVQLFGQSGMSENHGRLVFEYFDSQNPYFRPPIFTKIKELRDGVNRSTSSTMFGDPKQLESVKLSDLHPASWFSVAWYPICQIPAAAGRCETSFLTYHSLGKLVPQSGSMDNADGYDRIICPIVGLLGCYQDQGEKWFQLRQQLRFNPTLHVSSVTDHAELLNKRLRTLRNGASIMSNAVVPRASGEAMNYHSDYVHFWPGSL